MEYRAESAPKTLCVCVCVCVCVYVYTYILEAARDVG